MCWVEIKGLIGRMRLVWWDTFIHATNKISCVIHVRKLWSLKPPKTTNLQPKSLLSFFVFF